jgi:hypothetical protein
MNSFVAGPNDAVNRAGAISVALVSSKPELSVRSPGGDAVAPRRS